MKKLLKRRRFARLVFLTLVITIRVFAQKGGSGADHTMVPEQPYQDLTHSSKVFGHDKFYRLYVPGNYAKSAKRYPVIYFFHGWGGRHFKDDNANLEYEKLKMLVNKYQVIMVMWDGSMDEKEPRPYNIGQHEDIRFRQQMKDYFPELVNHIDSTYRTLTDRNHRGLIGFSMGGIMSLYLSGKYPDQVSAAVSMTGSPEFFMGYPENHTLYQVRYTFKNLQDVDTRIHTSSTDILYNLNEEVYQGALWEGKKIEFENFSGGHMVDKKGETHVFEKAMRFVTESFTKPKSKPEIWSHYDLYPNFDLWGYRVESDKDQPGFIYLKNVSEKGFGLFSQKWLPSGPKVNVKTITVSSAPLYRPNYLYEAVRYSAQEDRIVAETLKTDAEGRLHFKLDGGGYLIGINQKNAKADWVVVDYKTANGSRFLQNNKSDKLHIRLFNRGGLPLPNEKFSVRMQTRDSSVSLKNSVITFRADPNSRIVTLNPIEVVCSKKMPVHADPSEIKLEFDFVQSRTRDFIDIPVQFDADFFTDIRVDDGVAVREKSFGTGNADGIAAPGEHILFYQGSNRLRLYTEDQYVMQDNEILADEIIPARWPDGYTQISVIHISPDCPDGHKIECLASYETKTFNPIERKISWGKVSFTVQKRNNP